MHVIKIQPPDFLYTVMKQGMQKYSNFTNFKMQF